MSKLIPSSSSSVLAHTHKFSSVINAKSQLNWTCWRGKNFPISKEPSFFPLSLFSFKQSLKRKKRGGDLSLIGFYKSLSLSFSIAFCVSNKRFDEWTTFAYLSHSNNNWKKKPSSLLVLSSNFRSKRNEMRAARALCVRKYKYSIFS